MMISRVEYSNISAQRPKRPKSTRYGRLAPGTWQVKPTMEIYLDSAQPWVSLGGERQRFPKMPMLLG
jgi:hypothetical protein